MLFRSMAYVVKPFTPTDLIPAVEIALSRHAQVLALESEVSDLLDGLGYLLSSVSEFAGDRLSKGIDNVLSLFLNTASDDNEVEYLGEFVSFNFPSFGIAVEVVDDVSVLALLHFCEEIVGSTDIKSALEG